MRTIYFECNMGASGDMILGALLGLAQERAAFIEKLNGLGLEGVRVGYEAVRKRGIVGHSVSVHIAGGEEHSHDAHSGEARQSRGYVHRSISEITAIIDGMNASDYVRENVAEIYKSIAQAESEVHGMPVTDIHFHELGTMDALVDIAGVCMLMEELKPERVTASPVVTGFGQVHCAHGILPVPAPATALLLRGIPTRKGIVEGELCTPTGVALLRHFVDAFDENVVMTAEALGYGMGKKDMTALNCLRAFLGETKEPREALVELACNLDDMTAEEIGYAEGLLLGAGALDVFATPIQMKKSRPATMLTCLCMEADAEKLAALLLRHTSTAGVRTKLCGRFMLKSEVIPVMTAYGEIRIKKYTGSGVKRAKPEYEDVAAAARAHTVTFAEVRDAALRVYAEGGK